MHFFAKPSMSGDRRSATECTEGQKVMTSKASRTEFSSWTGSRDTMSIGPVLAKVLRPKIGR